MDPNVYSQPSQPAPQPMAQPMAQPVMTLPYQQNVIPMNQPKPIREDHRYS